VNAYPWYEEVSASEPLTQGDILEALLVPRYKSVSAMGEVRDLRETLQNSVEIQRWRSLVMTQACDLAEGKVDRIILCALFNLTEFKAAWISARRKAKSMTASDTPPSSKEEQAWQNFVNSVKDGKAFRYALLERRGAEGQIGLDFQILDFNELACLLLDFIGLWVKATNTNRLRLLPPYREHISQSFARFFMRVGLPQSVSL
jgi:hypothetical protein